MCRAYLHIRSSSSYVIRDDPYLRDYRKTAALRKAANQSMIVGGVVL